MILGLSSGSFSGMLTIKMGDGRRTRPHFHIVKLKGVSLLASPALKLSAT